jgi:hypothetical protein
MSEMAMGRVGETAIGREGETACERNRGTVCRCDGDGVMVACPTSPCAGQGSDFRKHFVGQGRVAVLAPKAWLRTA